MNGIWCTNLLFTESLCCNLRSILLSHGNDLALWFFIKFLSFVDKSENKKMPLLLVYFNRLPSYGSWAFQDAQKKSWSPTDKKKKKKRECNNDLLLCNKLSNIVGNSLHKINNVLFGLSLAYSLKLEPNWKEFLVSIFRLWWFQEVTFFSV